MIEVDGVASNDCSGGAGNGPSVGNDSMSLWSTVWWLSLSIAAGIVIALVPFICDLCERMAFLREREHVQELLHSLNQRPPVGVTRKRWDSAMLPVRSGVSNACWHHTKVPASEMRRLGDDIETMLRTDEPSVELLVRIWERIGECSPSAARYINDFRPFLDASLLPLLSPAAQAELRVKDGLSPTAREPSK